MFRMTAWRGTAQEPNELKLLAQPLTRREVDRWTRAQQLGALYRAASRLWKEGVRMDKAVRIVDSAMREAGEV